MIKLFGFVFLLAIWHSFLFYGKELGLSVLLFILPVCALILFVFKEWGKLQQRKGLLFAIPIILLSFTYFIYDGCFQGLNLVVMIGLFFMMLVAVSWSKWNLFMLIGDGLSILLKPFSCLSNVFDILYENLLPKFRGSVSVKKYLKSFFIILPIVIVILSLLASADMVFSELVSSLTTYFYEFFTNFMEKDFWKMVIWIVLFFVYVSAMLYYFIVDYSDEQVMKGWFLEDYNIEKKDCSGINCLFIILNIIYLIFDFIQIKSLMFHSVSHNIHYAEYARQGFFQLMFVSIINLSLLLYSKKYYDKNLKKKNSLLKVMSLMMVVLTFVIIISSFLRMNLYESQYGYTLLRLLVYVTLITEIILLIPTVLYILKDDFPIMKSYIVIMIIVYVCINFVNVDKLIACRNIKRYYDKDDIDLVYLENGRTDNLGELISFYQDVEDEEIKEDLKRYFQRLEISMNGIEEFNFSKLKGIEIIRKYK